MPIQPAAQVAAWQEALTGLRCCVVLGQARGGKIQPWHRCMRCFPVCLGCAVRPCCARSVRIRDL